MSVTSDPKPSTRSVAIGIDEELLDQVGVVPAEAQPVDLMNAVSQLARKQLSQRWVHTQSRQTDEKARRVYYLSMEFLIGRTMGNALAALDLTDETAAALQTHAKKLEDVADREPDAALGNGGLGRLAACFLDSMATVGLPSFGYGIRYEYGMFAQEIKQGAQIEHPDPWLEDGTAWEFPRVAVTYPVHFGGWVEHTAAGTPEAKAVWRPSAEVAAKAYDMVVPGHGTEHVSTLRLWKAAAPAHIDLNAFNTGDYARAASAKNEYENISWVLYPNDSTPAGRELRLRQEYFFVAASMQDLIKRHLAEHGTLDNLADKVAIHLNDTHPAIGVAELMRLLCDLHGMPWAKAWALCGRVFSYTNHTLMPEALETWPVALMHHVLPRHMEIIFRINQELMDIASAHRPGDTGFLARLSLIDESGEKRVRMANLSIVGSHKVNGVSALHSELLVQTIFADFASLWPDRFTNMTNGVTPRRWLAQCNPGLSALVDRTLAHTGGPSWREDLGALRGLLPHKGDADFQGEFMAIKRANKARLAALIERRTGIVVDPASLFDVQVKRIHEYKRQLLNVLHAVTRYQAILANPNGPDGAKGAPWVPRTIIFAGKAASSYFSAKNIIRLIHDVGSVVNNDPRIAGLLKVVFIPNYGVSVAETIMPGADLSEQISTAGTEASGTGNMKLALNGALTIGTDDGANIEIRQNVGDDNIFIFGLKTPEVQKFKQHGYQPMRFYESNPVLKNVLDAIAGGAFSPDEPGRYRGLVDSLLWGGDHYMLLADYDAYVATQLRVDALYRQPAQWAEKAIINVSGMGVFSSDRTIREYASTIWHIEPEAHKYGGQLMSGRLRAVSQKLRSIWSPSSLSPLLEPLPRRDQPTDEAPSRAARWRRHSHHAEADAHTESPGTLKLGPGQPWPLGATVDAATDGVNFAVFSSHAQSIELCVFDDSGTLEIARARLPGHTGDVFHGHLPAPAGGKTGLVYGLRAHGPWRPDKGLLFNPHKLLLDPYAREIVGRFDWGDEHFSADRAHPRQMDPRDNAATALKARVTRDDYDWAGDHRPHTPLADTVLYEMHVKGYSQLNPAVPEALRGRYAGLGHEASIAHLLRLGVTAVSLLPVHYRVDEERLVKMGLTNYWGYNTVGFFAPEPRLGMHPEDGKSLRDEFRDMVKALHAAGIEVILDVVFNHSAEGGQGGPTISFKGLDNAAYYRPIHQWKDGYDNLTGCGNTFDIRHPRVLQLVMDSLRYWVAEMHVDGYRFDLATVLGRGDHGFDRRAHFFAAVAQDPVLAGVKMIAEPWDIGPGGYQVGGFPNGWAEWNDKFRDDVRRYWLRHSSTRGAFAQRLCGSSDIYQAQGRAPAESVNYVISHDGFTLRDLLTYQEKHNEANGEDNRDGTGHNLGWNCGAEGPIDDAAINAVRARLQRAVIATNLLAQGTPMLCAGDELGHTQQGNNNPYCQDSPLTWIDWSTADDDLIAFTQRAIAIRQHALPFANRWYSGLTDPRGLHDLTWFSCDGEPLQGHAWQDPTSRCFGCLIGQPGRAKAPLLLLFNAESREHRFVLPGGVWEVVLDSTHPRGRGRVAWHGQGPVALAVPATSVMVLAAAGADVPP